MKKAPGVDGLGLWHGVVPDLGREAFISALVLTFGV